MRIDIILFESNIFSLIYHVIQLKVTSSKKKTCDVSFDFRLDLPFVKRGLNSVTQFDFDDFSNKLKP